MDTSQFTPEQLAALKLTRQSNTAFYDHTYEVIDKTTGEILQHQKKTITKTSGEPDYIKLYYKTMLAFNDVHDIPLDFILALSEQMHWTNDGSPLLFFNNRAVQEVICKACGGIGASMYAKYIKRCKEQGIIFPTKYRGTYEVNPFLIAKGKWDSISLLRADFDFVNGKWTRYVHETAPEAPETPDPEEPAPTEASKAS